METGSGEKDLGCRSDGGDPGSAENRGNIPLDTRQEVLHAVGAGERHPVIVASSKRLGGRIDGRPVGHGFDSDGRAHDRDRTCTAEETDEARRLLGAPGDDDAAPGERCD